MRLSDTSIRLYLNDFAWYGFKVTADQRTRGGPVMEKQGPNPVASEFNF